MAALVALAAIGCTVVPETGRSQFNLLSPQEEMSMGLTAFTQMKVEIPVSNDAELNAMVTRVGKRIAEQASGDMPDAQWEFVVFESEQANAFCLPGGKVGIYTGILPITKTEGGLATVMGHEVAHAVARHGGARVSQAMLLQLGGEVVNASLGDSDPKIQAGANVVYGLGAQLGVALPHSRLQESEADHIGLLYMARAGYDPREAVAFWQRFAEFNKQHGGDTPWFLRTHPLDTTRVSQLEELMPEAMEEYRRSGATE